MKSLPYIKSNILSWKSFVFGPW